MLVGELHGPKHVVFVFFFLQKKSTWSLSMLVLSPSTSFGQHLLLASCNGTWGEASVPTMWWGSGAGCSPRDATSCLAAAAWGPRHLHP